MLFQYYDGPHEPVTQALSPTYCSHLRDAQERSFDVPDVKRRRIDVNDTPDLEQPDFDQAEDGPKSTDLDAAVPVQAESTPAQTPPTAEMDVEPRTTASAEAGLVKSGPADVGPSSPCSAPMPAGAVDADATPAAQPATTESALAQSPSVRASPSTSPCTTCQTEAGTVIAPLSGGKKYVLLCLPCAKSTSFCEKCQGICKRGAKEELERCTVCGYLLCDPACPGACADCSGPLRSLHIRMCKKGECRQGWAEAGKFCTSCGSCALKACTAKFSTCRKPGCRIGALPDPCARSNGKRAPPTAKHYHCAVCIEKATAAGSACPHCNKVCGCGRCATCMTGACCYGSAGPQPCKIKGCQTDVCKRCAQKAKSSGKFSGHCVKHHGMQRSAKVSGAKLANHGIGAAPAVVVAPPSEKKDKRSKCEGCGGTERPDRPRFCMVGGVYYCKACAPAAPEIEAPVEAAATPIDDAQPIESAEPHPAGTDEGAVPVEAPTDEAQPIEAAELLTASTDEEHAPVETDTTPTDEAQPIERADLCTREAASPVEAPEQLATEAPHARAGSSDTRDVDPVAAETDCLIASSESNRTAEPMVVDSAEPTIDTPIGGVSDAPTATE